MKRNVRNLVAASLATGAVIAGGSALASALEAQSGSTLAHVNTPALASNLISVDAQQAHPAVSVDSTAPASTGTTLSADAPTVAGMAAGAAGGAAKYTTGMAAGAAGGGAKYAISIAAGAAGGALKFGLNTLAPTAAADSVSASQATASTNAGGVDTAISIAALPVASSVAGAAGNTAGVAAGAAGGAAGGALGLGGATLAPTVAAI